MTKLRKFFASSVMVMTVVVMSGLTAPVATKAAVQAGDLIKKDGLSAVYYLGEDGKRYVFPNEATYFSWYSDFSGVVTISSEELASYPLGANVVIRPGTKLVKITTDPKVYAVEANGTLRHVQTEADAIALFGANWAKRVVDVADSFFTNYTIGNPLASNEVPAGSLVKKAGEGNIYYYDGSDYRLVEDEVAFLANRFKFDDVLTINNFTPSGDTIIGAEAGIIKTSQSGATTGFQPGQGSGVTVALSSATPASASVPSAVGRIPFTKLNLTASSDGAAYIEAITVKRTGLTAFGNNNPIFKVWAEKDGVRISSKKSLSNDEAVLVFSPILVIPAGQTIALDILAEINDLGGNGSLGIASASAVSASGSSVSGSFPIAGNLMSFVSGYEVAEITFTKQSVSGNTEVGKDNVELGKFELSFNKDIVFQSLTLRNEGSEDLSNVLANIRLENNKDEVVASNPVINGRYITFNLSSGGLNLLLEDGGSKYFIIKGDVIAKEQQASSTIKLSLNKKEDLVAYEKATGFGVSYDTHLNTAEPLTEIVIAGGEITLAKHKDNPSNQYVSESDNNILALIANVKADEPFTADDGITVLHTISGDSFKNAKIYLNGLLLGTKEELTNGATSTLISSTASFKKGDNKIEIKVSVKSSVTSDNYILFNLAPESFAGAKYDNNDLGIDTVIGSAKGAKLIVSGAGTLSVANVDLDSADGNILLAGINNQEIGKFKFTAKNTASEIKEIKLFNASSTANIATTTDEVYGLFSSIDVYDGSTKLGSLTEEADGKFSFKKNISLTAASSKTLTFKANIHNINNENDTNKAIQLAVEGVEYKPEGKSTDLFIGAEYDTTLISNLIKAEKFVVRTSSFTITKLTTPESGKDVGQEVLRFSITNKGNDIRILFATTTNILATSGATSTDFELRELDKYKNLASSSIDIERGVTKTFVVTATTTAALKDTSLTTSLKSLGITWQEYINGEFVGVENNGSITKDGFYDVENIKRFPISNTITFK